MVTAHRKVIHKTRQVKRWGGIQFTTVCGRMRETSDGMNIADGSEVTCKFCLRIMKRDKKYKYEDYKKEVISNLQHDQ
jgi:hypothetical protein